MKTEYRKLSLIKNFIEKNSIAVLDDILNDSLENITYVLYVY